MPGEVQGCVGCHADRNSAMSRVGSQFAIHRTAQKLQEPAWGVKGFSYQEVVQGVFDRNCVECHNAREQPGDVDLSGDMTDFSCAQSFAAAINPLSSFRLLHSDAEVEAHLRCMSAVLQPGRSPV